MTREYRNVSTMHHIIALILLFSCMGAIAKPAVVTASAAEIEKQWLRYRLNSTGVRPTTSFLISSALTMRPRRTTYP